LRLEGAKKLRLKGERDLVATLPDGGQLVQHLPAIYQVRDGKREKIQGRVVLRGKGTIGFELAKYDRHRAIYIDPGLVYSTYLGGSRSDDGFGIAVDSGGNAYVTGAASSADFPTTSGAFQTAIPNPNGTAFVAKLNPSASGEASLVYSTYLGGSDSDGGGRIAVDSSGDAYVTGTTDSTDFPTTPGAFQSVNNSAGTLVGSNAFVTVLNPTGSSLLYSTYLGGYQGGEIFYALGGLSGIAVDASGAAYVTGSTLAISSSSCGGGGVPFDCCTGPGTGTCIPFPTTPGAYQRVNNAPGGIEVFMAKLDPSASGPASLLYSTYLGGSGGAGAGGIAVDSAGNAYLTGVAGAHFPITPGAFQTVSNGDGGAVNSFVAKLNPSAAGAASLVYSTYLGGSGINYPGVETIGDKGTGIAVDSAGDAYVTGTTVSVSNANCGGNGVTSFGLYELCCTGPGTGTCIPFPTTAGAFQSVSNGFTNPFGFGNAFVTKLNAAGSALVYSTYLGGSGGEYASSIAIDSAGDAYVTGDTGSISNAQCIEVNPAPCCTGFGTGTCIPFPTTPGAFQPANSAVTNGDANAFVAKLNPSAFGGASLVYSTYLGGNGGPSSLGDGSSSIAVDAAGDSYVTGYTFSADFPTTPGAFQTVNNAAASPRNEGANAFVTELDMIPGPTPTPTISPTPTATMTPTATISPTATATATATPVPDTLAIVPSEVSFGKHSADSTTERSVKVKAKESNKLPILIVSIAISGGSFSTDGTALNSCAKAESLAPGMSCNVRIKFAPIPEGSTGGRPPDTGTLTVTTNAETVKPLGGVVSLKGGVK
jgi:hypothetical protein